MAMHGRLSEFDSAREEWKSYVERLELYFTANDVQDETKQRAILLTACGASTYRTVKSLLAPTNPTDVDYKEIVKQMQSHYHPTPSTTVQRFQFNSRVRKPGESVATFVAELKKLSEHCEFGASLDEMIRDRLVCGIGDERSQRRLLAEPNLDFKKAFQLAQSLEAADRNVKDLQHVPGRPDKLYRLHSQPDAGARRPQTLRCYRCGADHKPTDCGFKDAECHYCHKKGHIAKVCRSKARDGKRKPPNRKPPQKGTHQVTEVPGDEAEYSLYHIPSTSARPLLVTVTLNSSETQMEVDTGATLSIISIATYRKLWPKEQAPRLEPSQATLKTYTGERIAVEGTISVEVAYERQRARLNLLVVAGDGPSLLGRDWLQRLRLNWSQLHYVPSSSSTRVQEVLDRHPDVFKEELGMLRGTTAKIQLNPSAQPKFYRARPVPYALRAKVEHELDRLEKDGVITPVQFADWAAPIVPVVKKDGTLRICGDYKLTVNRAAQADTYPLPRIDGLFASLSGGTTFSKLDLAHAYQQILLDDGSKACVTINTHKGLYEYNRLPFGVAAAPSIFQRTMENVLRDLPRVCVYLDDILITGKTEEDHLCNLERVLTRLEQAGLRLKRSKCAFCLPSVQYLGHQISANGLQPTDEKIRAIRDAPAPKDVSQLKSFLGLVNYYGKFLPHLSSTLSPLYSLLQKQSQWTWGNSQREAFQKAKAQLTSDCLLVHYDPDRELVLACDASPYGIGAVLSHKMDDGQEKPVAFASRSLAPAERKYSQLDREALAIIFGVKKFQQFLLGRRFTILSDHKPLQHLFNETSAVPTMASARIRRWALTLAAYDYTIAYKPGEKHGNADVLSRLPLPEAPASIPIPGETVLLVDTLQSSIVTVRQIRTWTERDPVLSKVRDCILRGWTHSSDPQLKPYQQRKTELSVHDGCVLWGSRVVVPPAGRTKVVEELHEGHQGTSRMKSLARSFVWWPLMDRDLEEKAKSCFTCQQTRHLPPPAPLHPWEWPQRPWARLHADYAGPFLGKMFLIVVDAYSKWLEVKPVSSATSATTIEQLRAIFATHGLPEMLVTDNGSIFTSAEFQQFTKLNGIRHTKSAPYHPASNGLAERAVQTFKESMKKSTEDSLDTRIARFLFRYRLTPHSTTGMAPAQLLLGRRPRSHLDLLKPDIATRVQGKQYDQKTQHDLHSKGRTFQVGDTVFARNFSSGILWLPGRVIAVNGPLSYLVELEGGQQIRRHVDHLRSRASIPDLPPAATDDMVDIPLPSTELEQVTPSEPVPAEGPPLRRSSRVVHPPDRYSS